MSEIRNMIIGNGRSLGLFVLGATALVFTMFFMTRDQIQANEREVMVQQLESVLSSVTYNNDILAQVSMLNDAHATGVNTPLPYYLAKENGAVVAIVFTVIAPDGYSGPIELLIGLRPSGELLSVRVIAHQETPGLGDGIEIKKSPWITQFNGQSLHKTALSNWKVIKDSGVFDQMTGATITPRAVVKAIRTLLQYFDANKDQFLRKQDNPHATLSDNSK
jgi:electron transport complex protein RnfG